MTPFVQTLIGNAYIELALWTKPNGRPYQESDRDMREHLHTYYSAVGLTDRDRAGVAEEDLPAHEQKVVDRRTRLASRDKIAWSAAFISYLFQESGAGDDFPVALAHSRYVTELKANALRDPNAFPFQTYPIETFKPAVGDVICVWRDGDDSTRAIERPRIHGRRVSWDALDADSWAHFPSHCDLVVDINGQSVTAIGGNVDQSVSVTRYHLNRQERVDHWRAMALIKNYK